MSRVILKEEDFLEEFGYSGLVPAICSALGETVWEPQFGADDALRERIKYAIKHGHFPEELYFDSACVYNRKDRRFSSIQVSFRSCVRVVTLRGVSEGAGKWNFERMVDKTLGPQS